MGALRQAFLGLSLIFAAPAHAGPVDRWAGHIAEASLRFGIPEAWIRRVMAAESGGRTTMNGRPIVSHAGAMGLMQLMPGTWREMRAAYGLGADPHDPRDNIIAGTAYLRAMYDRFGYPGLFGAYNAGPARYARHLTTGRSLPGETVAYVSRVTDHSPGSAPRPALAPEPVQLPAAPPIFALRSRAETVVMAPAPAREAQSPGSLFVQLSVPPRR